MTRSSAARWVRLIPSWHEDVLDIRCLDSNGFEAPPRGPTRSRDWAILHARARPFARGNFPLLATSVRWPTRAADLLADLLDSASVPRIDSAGIAHKVPIAVLVSQAVGGPTPPEEFFHALMRVGQVEPDRYVIVMESDAAPPSPFVLPFIVAASREAYRSLRILSQRILAGLTADERDNAIRVQRWQSQEPFAGAPDIVIDDIRNLAAIRSGLQGTRLFIAADPDRRVGELPPNWLPSGASGVVLPVGGAAAAEWSRELLLGLIHDLPLHEATLEAIDRTIGRTRRTEVRMWSSVDGLDSLRMTNAYTQFMDATRPLFRFNGISDASFVGDLPIAPREAIDKAVQLATAASLNFKRESDGLSELARASAARERAYAALDELIARSREAGGREVEESVEPRRVTMWLEHDPSGGDPSRWMWKLSENSTLAQADSYLLNVGIGIRWDTDLVEAGAPPIDPLLPAWDSDDRDLRVAVFSDSSEIVGDASRVLTLPRRGPSEPVTFRFVTPADGETTRIRVLVYFRSHLLQALTLDAPLSAHEKWIPRDGVRARVQFSRSVAFTDLDSTPKRLLAVATNDDLRGATHSFMFESGHGVRLTETMTSKARDAFTHYLADVASMLDSDEHLAADDFDDAVRRLAETGGDVWQQLWVLLPQSTKRALSRVRKSARGTIQLTRFEPEFSFPWSMLYDWRLPETHSEIDAAEVCRGVVDGAPCSCGADTPGICVRGFWGIRLVIEELIGEGTNERLAVARAGEAGRPVVYTNGVNDKWSDEIATKLDSTFGNLVEDFSSDASLIQRLWDADRRPAVLIAVGHVATRKDEQKDDESRAPRMYVRAQERYLTVSTLVNAQIDHGVDQWTAPWRPVVLLLGCETNRGDLTQAHNLVLAFISVGAVSVLATEHAIDTRLARDVAYAVVSGLSSTGLGEGLRLWRAQRMAERNPLGLAFTCFGGADVVVEQLAPALTTPPHRENRI